MLTNANTRLRISTPLGMTCQPYNRCAAAPTGTREARSEIQTAEQTIIVGGVGLGIGGHDGSQPVLHVQFECGGDPGDVDAERPAQLSKRAAECPAMMASAVRIVDAVAPVGPDPLKELPAGRPYRAKTRGQLRAAVQLAQLIAETVPDFDHRVDAM